MQMKKTVWIGAIFVLSLLLAACGSTSGDQETAEACAALGEVSEALAEFDGLDDASTTEEAQERSALLGKAKENMQAAAAVLGEDKVNGINLNLEALIQNISQMAEGETIAASQIDFKWDLIAAMAGTLDLLNSECNVTNLGRPG
jgi:hypothetical protein